MIGAWQGFWVAYVGIPAFIVTLAGMLIFRGGTSSSASPTRCRSATTSRRSAPGYLPEVGPDTGYNNLTLLLGSALCAAIVFGALRTPARTSARSAPS